jgi:hypothetical protein
MFDFYLELTALDRLGLVLGLMPAVLIGGALLLTLAGAVRAAWRVRRNKDT